MSPKTLSSVSSRRQEVWGDPIGHSQSPQLHLAAYKTLGLDWDYRRTRVSAANLADSFNTLPAEVGGLSLTMPLKEGILELVPDQRGPVTLLHAANTVVRSEQGWWLDNTDWFGVDAVLRDHGGVGGSDIWVLGAGATARSVIYALSLHRPQSVSLVVRESSRAMVSQVLGETLGLSIHTVTFDDISRLPQPEWVISTIPNGALDDPGILSNVAAHSRLLDAAYDPWPTPLARVWSESEQPVISGLAMLTYQALAQVRAFVNGDTGVPLPGESDVLAAMREAVGLGKAPESSESVGE